MASKAPEQPAPKRWGRKRSQERDRKLQRKAFWGGVLVFVFALLWMILEFALGGLL
jgi:hypothetical protein